jgi:hypothetical protein
MFMKTIAHVTLMLTLLTAAASIAALPDTGQVNNEYDRSDPALTAWANDVHSYHQGYQDYQAPELGFADYGLETDVLGSAGTPFSLGDGGWIVLDFAAPIINGDGDDFVVFENGMDFNGVFMEIGFVGVSSDGVNFSRMPSFCRRATQPGPWDSSDPADFYNLAGNFLGGTGFDLNDLLLADDALVQAGTVDLQNIQYLRIVDVVGDITGPGGSADFLGRPVADPYPTPGLSSGMDLTGAAVINSGQTVHNEDLTWAGVKSMFR